MVDLVSDTGEADGLAGGAAGEDVVAAGGQGVRVALAVEGVAGGEWTDVKLLEDGATGRLGVEAVEAVGTVDLGHEDLVKGG